MLNAGRIVLQAYTNSLPLLDHVPVGNDIALRINNHAGAEGTLTNRVVAARTSLSTRAAEKAVEKVIHAPAATAVVLIIGTLLPTPTPVRTLDGRLGIDVDHTRS